MLEKDLQRQLNVTRLTNSDARGAAAITRIGQQPEASRGEVGNRVGPVPDIKDIEKLETKLDFDRFGDRRRLEK